jgi:hypothetical protein
MLPVGNRAEPRETQMDQDVQKAVEAALKARDQQRSKSAVQTVGALLVCFALVMILSAVLPSCINQDPVAKRRAQTATHQGN